MRPKHPPDPVMKSPIVKRSVNINGRKTSVSLEDELWNALKKSRLPERFHFKSLF